MSSSVTRRTAPMLVAAALIGGCLAASATASKSTHADGQLVGAGSTFVAAARVPVAGGIPVPVGRQHRVPAVGSGGGIAAITNRTVDFGASDAPLTPDQLPRVRAATRSRGRSVARR